MYSTFSFENGQGQSFQQFISLLKDFAISRRSKIPLEPKTKSLIAVSRIYPHEICEYFYELVSQDCFPAGKLKINSNTFDPQQTAIAL